jgi:hypothetical protein
MNLGNLRLYHHDDMLSTISPDFLSISGPWLRCEAAYSPCDKRNISPRQRRLTQRWPMSVRTSAHHVTDSLPVFGRRNRHQRSRLNAHTS